MKEARKVTQSESMQRAINRDVREKASMKRQENGTEGAARPNDPNNLEIVFVEPLIKRKIMKSKNGEIYSKRKAFYQK